MTVSAKTGAQGNFWTSLPVLPDEQPPNSLMFRALDSSPLHGVLLLAHMFPIVGDTFSLLAYAFMLDFKRYTHVVHLRLHTQPPLAHLLVFPRNLDCFAQGIDEASTLLHIVSNVFSKEVAYAS